MRELEYGFGLERFTTSEKCFDYFMSKMIPEARTHMDSAKLTHLVKPIQQYTEEELIELALLIQFKDTYAYTDEKMFAEELQRQKNRFYAVQNAE